MKKSPFTNLIAEIYSEGYAAASAKLTSQIRRRAYQMGWPTSLSRHLVVDVDSSGKYIVRYPKQLAKAINHIEYGDQNTPYNPAIRSFLKGITNTGMEDAVAQVLKRKGVI